MARLLASDALLAVSQRQRQIAELLRGLGLLAELLDHLAVVGGDGRTSRCRTR